MQFFDQFKQTTFNMIHYIKPFATFLKEHPSLRYGVVSLVLFIIGIVLLDSKPKKAKSATNRSGHTNNYYIIVNNKELSSVAGENVMATRLDLAKAYIEMGQKKLATQLLDQVVQNGDPGQQNEAKSLLKKV